MPLVGGVPWFLAVGASPCGFAEHPTGPASEQMSWRVRETPQRTEAEVCPWGNLGSDTYGFCHLVFVGSESLSPAYARGEGLQEDLKTKPSKADTDFPAPL